MSLLPEQIIPETVPLGEMLPDGKVKIAHNWWLLFYNLWLNVLGGGSGQASSVETVKVGTSPFTYVATGGGAVLITGGTVSKIQISRGSVVTTLPKICGYFPLRTNDQITVIYAHGSGIGVNNPILPVAPSMQFWPQ